jgi:hypothetical protein
LIAQSAVAASDYRGLQLYPDATLFDILKGPLRAASDASRQDILILRLMTNGRWS